MMPSLNFPQYEFTIKSLNKRKEVFDDFRRRFVALTPEEWVRQHLARYLVSEKKCPATLIHIEASLNVNHLRRRSDLVVYGRNMQPMLLAECKAPDVPITQTVFSQISHYNLVYKVPYLLVTNGVNHFFCKINVEEKGYAFLDYLPEYDLW